MGLITNFLSIIIGGILGLTIGKKFNEDIKNIIVDCAGIFIMVIGIKSVLVADLNIKAILDGVISIVLTSIYGIGVIFSAISVTIYQGIFYLFASQIKDYLSPQAISELNAVGGVLVLAIGINMTFKKDIKTANMLPAIFIPLLISIFS